MLTFFVGEPWPGLVNEERLSPDLETPVNDLITESCLGIPIDWFALWLSNPNCLFKNTCSSSAWISISLAKT